LTARLRARDVFINCPFDTGYRSIFRAIVFAINDLGFVVRCALEVDDAGEVRLTKILRLIGQCAYGVHDISAVGLSAQSGLPRFNMPLELGLDLGCRWFGSKAQRTKSCLILDTEPYRYRASVSDISGQDIHVHGGDPDRAIVEVRDWLVNASRARRMPGGAEIVARYTRFRRDLPRMCRALKRREQDLTFFDYSEMVSVWLREAR